MVAPVVLFVVGFWQIPLSFAGPALTHLPGDLIDTRFNNYVLEHGYRWLTGPRAGFWDAPFCYPAAGMTAASDAHIGTLPLYAAVRACGAGPERAFQLWWLTLFAANYVAAYLSLRRLGFRRTGSAAGAYLFAFGLPVVGQIGHAQLTPRFLVPVAFAAAWAFARRPGWRSLAVAAGSVVGQMYLTLYIGLLLAVVLVPFVLIAWPAWRDIVFPSRREFALRSLVIAASIAAAWLLLRPYLATAGGVRPLDPDVRAIAPDAAAWLRPPPESATWGWARPHLGTPSYEHEKQLYPGGVAVVAVCVAFVRRDRLALAAAACVLAVPLFFAEVGGRSLYLAALDVPGVAKLRGSGRVMLVLLAPLAVCVASFIDAARRWHPLAAVALLGLLAADHAIRPANPGETYNDGEPYYRVPLADVVSRREAWTAAVRAAGPRPTMVYAFDAGLPPTEWAVEQLDVMWAALEVGAPTANGYSGYWPHGWMRFDSACGLMHWVRQKTPLSPAFLAGVVVLGEPPAGADRELERALRADVRRGSKPPRGGCR